MGCDRYMPERSELEKFQQESYIRRQLEAYVPLNEIQVLEERASQMAVAVESLRKRVTPRMRQEGQIPGHYLMVQPLVEQSVLGITIEDMAEAAFGRKDEEAIKEAKKRLPGLRYALISEDTHLVIDEISEQLEADKPATTRYYIRYIYPEEPRQSRVEFLSHYGVTAANLPMANIQEAQRHEQSAVLDTPDSPENSLQSLAKLWRSKIERFSPDSSVSIYREPQQNERLIPFNSVLAGEMARQREGYHSDFNPLRLVTRPRQLQSMRFMIFQPLHVGEDLTTPISEDSEMERVYAGTGQWGREMAVFFPNKLRTGVIQEYYAGSELFETYTQEQVVKFYLIATRRYEELALGILEGLQEMSEEKVNSAIDKAFSSSSEFPEYKAILEESPLDDPDLWTAHAVYSILSHPSPAISDEDRKKLYTIAEQLGLTDRLVMIAEELASPQLGHIPDEIVGKWKKVYGEAQKRLRPEEKFALNPFEEEELEAWEMLHPHSEQPPYWVVIAWLRQPDIVDRSLLMRNKLYEPIADIIGLYGESRSIYQVANQYNVSEDDLIDEMFELWRKMRHGDSSYIDDEDY